MQARRLSLKATYGVCLLFVVIGLGVAVQSLLVSVPSTREVVGTVAMSQLIDRNRRQQWIEFKLDGVEQEFVYGYPFLDAKSKAELLRPGASISMKISEGHRVSIWALTVNGRVLVEPDSVLEQYREKALGGVAIATAALAALAFLRFRKSRSERSAAPK